MHPNGRGSSQTHMSAASRSAREFRDSGAPDLGIAQLHGAIRTNVLEQQRKQGLAILVREEKLALDQLDLVRLEHIPREGFLTASRAAFVPDVPLWPVTRHLHHQGRTLSATLFLA
jgi:hypothetical protein